MNNIEMLASVARGLGPLKKDAVFVGGATIELYIAGQAGLKIRPTDDVDCVVEVVSRAEYHKLEERLRELGFKHPMAEKAPICRWKYEGILVDVMPIEGKILGFSNRWYPEGFETSVLTKLPDGQEIRIFALPYLIASKLEAFKDRGNGDFMGSTDLEDIVAVLDGAPDFQEQIERASEPLKAYLREGFEEFIRDERFLDALEGHLPPAGRQERVSRARAIIEKLSK
jgi:predicted nucleotidyltransferase